MRPLAIEAVAGAPLFVPGIAIIRGIATPVVDLGILLGTAVDANVRGTAARFVTLRLGERRVVLFVDAVCGIRELDALTAQELPPLLQGACSDFMEAIGTLDMQLMIVLRSCWRLPDALWNPTAANPIPESA
jgi:purine-binding chemotaxis protein CheW